MRPCQVKNLGHAGGKEGKNGVCGWGHEKQKKWKMVNKFEERMFRWTCLTAAWFHKGLWGNERKSVLCLIGHQSDESVNLSHTHTVSTCHCSHGMCKTTFKKKKEKRTDYLKN